MEDRPNGTRSNSPSDDAAKALRDLQMQTWLDDAKAGRGQSSFAFSLMDVLPYLIGVAGLLGFAVLVSWALQNLP